MVLVLFDVIVSVLLSLVVCFFIEVSLSCFLCMVVGSKL